MTTDPTKNAGPWPMVVVILTLLLCLSVAGHVFSYYRIMNERNYSKWQSSIAIKKEKEAVVQRMIAQAEQQIAMQQKLIAEMAEQEAMKQQTIAAQHREETERQKALAERWHREYERLKSSRATEAND